MLFPLLGSIFLVLFMILLITTYTSHTDDVGCGHGLGYCLNFPLEGGVSDDVFVPLFKEVMQKVCNVFQPEAVVLQCGGASLAGERNGDFNLTLRCVAY